MISYQQNRIENNYQEGEYPYVIIAKGFIPEKGNAATVSTLLALYLELL